MAHENFKPAEKSPPRHSSGSPAEQRRVHAHQLVASGVERRERSASLAAFALDGVRDVDKLLGTGSYGTVKELEFCGKQLVCSRMMFKALFFNDHKEELVRMHGGYIL